MAAWPRNSNKAHQIAIFRPLRYDASSVTASTSRNMRSNNGLRGPPVKVVARARNAASTSSITATRGRARTRTSPSDELEHPCEPDVDDREREQALRRGTGQQRDAEHGEGCCHPTCLEQAEALGKRREIGRGWAHENSSISDRRSIGASASWRERRSNRPWITRNRQAAAASTKSATADRVARIRARSPVGAAGSSAPSRTADADGAAVAAAMSAGLRAAPPR